MHICSRPITAKVKDLEFIQAHLVREPASHGKDVGSNATVVEIYFLVTYQPK